MRFLSALVPRFFRQGMFWCAYVLLLAVSVFSILAPLDVLKYLHPFVLGAVVLIPAVGWLVVFIRALYRGGE